MRDDTLTPLELEERHYLGLRGTQVFTRNLGDLEELTLIFRCSKLISYAFLEAKNYKETPETPQKQRFFLTPHFSCGLRH